MLPPPQILAILWPRAPAAVLALAFRSLQLVDAHLTSFIHIGAVFCGRLRCHRAACGFLLRPPCHLIDSFSESAAERSNC